MIHKKVVPLKTTYLFHKMTKVGVTPVTLNKSAKEYDQTEFTILVFKRYDELANEMGGTVLGP